MTTKYTVHTNGSVRVHYIKTPWTLLGLTARDIVSVVSSGLIFWLLYIGSAILFGSVVL